MSPASQTAASSAPSAAAKTFEPSISIFHAPPSATDREQPGSYRSVGWLASPPGRRSVLLDSLLNGIAGGVAATRSDASHPPCLYHVKLTTSTSAYPALNPCVDFSVMAVPMPTSDASYACMPGSHPHGPYGETIHAEPWEFERSLDGQTLDRMAERAATVAKTLMSEAHKRERNSEEGPTDNVRLWYDEELTRTHGDTYSVAGHVQLGP